MDEAEPISCALCGRTLAAHASYVVRIDVFADPSLPPMTAEQLAAADVDQTLREVIEQTKHLSADDLQDQVHRRFEYRLCPRCQPHYLANPLGRPREARVGTN
jgi:hypothetical protein